MNFRSTTTAISFTYLYTYEGDVFRSSSNYSQRSPNSSNAVATALVASDHPQMLEEEVYTTNCLLNLTGDTYTIEDIHILDITRNNYTLNLVNFMFWVFDYHPELLVYREALKYAHRMVME